MQTSTNDRPRTIAAYEETFAALADLAGIDCTMSEIALHFRVPVADLQDFLERTPEARAALKRGHEDGTERLRRMCERHAAADRAKREKRGTRKRRTAA